MSQGSPHRLFLDCAARLLLVAGLLDAAGTAATTDDRAVGSIAPKRADDSVVQTPETTSAAVSVFPGDNIQLRVTANPPGTTFVLKSGVHRLQTIRPKDGDTFVGEGDAVLSGARPLTTFLRSGSYWVATGQNQQGARQGVCQTGYPRCSFPEQLFINGQGLTHVASLSEVKAGTWYFDYAADRIYFADDPTGQQVETSVTPLAFEPTANNVTISGLTIERFASSAQQGAIQAAGRSGWVVKNNVVRWNHGAGIRVGGRAHVQQNDIRDNGQIGILGGGDDVVVENNEISHNNNARFEAQWEAGGAKFIATRNLIVRGNFVHHNGGPGLWTDVDNVATLYENNTCEDNERMGIFHEISYAAVIRNNFVRRNGFGFPDWIWGAGILVAGSRDVEVYGNLVEGNADGIGAVQQNRGSGAYGPYEIWNLWVHDNLITDNAGWTGLVQDVGDTSYFTSHNNWFDRNQYRYGSKPFPFTWMDRERSESAWKVYRQDTNGTFSQ